MADKFTYLNIKNAPDYLEELGIKPVFVPKQDGYRPHYAFLDIKNDLEIFACETLEQLVEEAKDRLNQLT